MVGGILMANFCAECGTKLEYGAIFCSECGTRVVNKTEELARKINAEKATNAVPNNRHSSPKKDGRNALCVFLAVVLAVEFVIAGFKWPGFFRRDDGKNAGYENKAFVSTGALDEVLPVRNEEELNWEEVQSDSATMPSSGGSVTLCGVTVFSSAENLNGDETVEVIDYGTQTSNGEEIHKFDISLGEHRQFETPVAITYPISKNQDEDVAVVHYDEEKDEWIPLASEYDEETETVTAYFSSLSPTKLIKEKNTFHNSLYYVEYGTNEYGEPTSRNAEMNVSKYYWSILKKLNPQKLSDEALKFAPDPSLYATDFEKYRDDYFRDRDAAIDENSIIWTIAGPALDICNQLMQNTNGFRYSDLDYSDAFGNALGWVTLTMATFQTYDDFRKAGGDWNAVREPAKNLYKNLFSNSGTIYSLATGYGSIGFTVAFAGVSIVAFGLDKAIEYAEKEMEKRTADVFNTYFEDVAPFDKNEWYETFREAYYQTGNDPNEASKIISDKINSTVERFWTDIYDEENIDVLVAAAEGDTKNIFTKNNIYFYNVTSEEKEMLNSQMKNTIWKKFKKETMPMVNTFLVERMQESVLENLSKFTESFNEYLEFEILESVPDIESNAESVAECAGCTLAFANDDGIIEDWDVIRISEDMTDGWMKDYSCTIIGYAEAGCPDRIYVFESDEAMRNGDKPLQVKKFNVSIDGTTRIDFTKGNDEPEDEKSSVSEGNFPYIDMETKICYAFDGTYNYVNFGDSKEFYAGRPARFTMNTDGSFKVVIPSLGGYAKDNWQVKSHDGITISGTFNGAKKEKISKSMFRNGEQSASEEQTVRMKCDELTFSASTIEIATTVDWDGDVIVTTDKYIFKQVDPKLSSTYAYLYVAKDGTFNVDISMEGEEENSWTSVGSDYNEGGSDKNSKFYSYMIDGVVSADDVKLLQN